MKKIIAVLVACVMMFSVACFAEDVTYTDKNTVKVVQETLNSLGYDSGTPDGIIGARTTGAITKYQTDKGLTVNGTITDELLKSLDIDDEIEEMAKIEAEKANYSGDYTYEQLARNPDSYFGDKVKFTGTVIQVIEEDGIGNIRLKVNSNYDVIFIEYDTTKLSYHILEDDNITVYGTSVGLLSYKSIMGQTITIPDIVADYIELN